MSNLIDCLFIGYNDMDFTDYEKRIREMGINSGAYRDLNLNFIQYDDRPFHFPGIFNLFYCSDKFLKEKPQPLSLADTFNPAIAYLGTYLQRRGFTFDYVNSFQDKKEELKEKLVSGNILAIAIITTLYISVFPITEIMDFLKKYNRKAKIIIGGPFISAQVRNQTPDELEYFFGEIIGADFYVNSAQGETALVEILHALKNNLPFESINNIYYKRNNRYLAAPILLESNQLSENMVDWNLFPGRLGEIVNVRTAISCPFSCAFCGFPEHAGKYQTVAVELIEKELKTLNQIDPITSVYFTDDTFNVPRGRFKRILKMMVKNKFRFSWQSNLRCQFLDRETVELIKESGCEGVFLGIESGSPQILKNMNKAATVDKYIRGICLLKEYGILNFGSFIIGFPGETPETVQETVQFIKESGIDFFRIHLWYCNQVTPIWREREKYQINGSNFEWRHATMDSQTAANYIDDIFLSIETPIWIPQYNFDFDNIFHIMKRGFSLEAIKNIINSFNRGIREKFEQPAKKEVSVDIIKQLKRFCQGSHEADDRLPVNVNGILLENYQAEFDF